VNHRDVQVLEPGLLRIEQRTLVPQHEIGTDVSGPACIYSRVHVRRGTIAYLHGNLRIDAPRRFDVFLPPFTIVQASLDTCDVDSSAWVFRLATETRPVQPVLFPVNDDWRPESPGDVLSRVRSLPTETDIGRAPNPGRLAGDTKTIIDSEYGTSLDIGSIAARCRVPPAALSRAFKTAYGVPPVRYRHQVRIVDALTRLAVGAVPADVFQDVGFSDLSRFYKIFRKLACAAPGTYRPARSRNAKT
jgi:AraC-like DNA-binding protein